MIEHRACRDYPYFPSVGDAWRQPQMSVDAADRLERRAQPDLTGSAGYAYMFLTGPTAIS